MSYERPARVRGHSSVDVRLIPVLRPEVTHESLGGGRVHLAMFGADLDERLVDIWCHAGGVATDIEMGALGEPRPKIGAILAHLVLHIDFLFRIARPGEGELGERARRLEPRQLVLIEKIGGAPPMAEEEPGRALGLGGHAFLQKRPERRDACSRTYHDDRRISGGGEREIISALDICVDLFAGAHSRAGDFGGYAKLFAPS